MLNFLTSFPSYLLGLLALAVPIIIHLFSKSKGKPVAVGTLKFFQQVKPVKMKQVKLVEIFLLVLRLLMLICAVLLVAQLWWIDNDSDSNEEFYLISVNWLNQSSMEEKRELATKLTENNAYILNSKLSSISPDKILTWETSEGSDLKLKNKPLWSAINTAHYKLAKEVAFHIYTDNLASNFIGKPVKISQPIQWHI
ncbi:MAG: BatA domain-containing protein, partial [Thalassotalea sp.]|nr:BatA domain-containing protein [Thalassotalea sp.]